MPLRSGSSKEAVKANLKRLKKEKVPRGQALAIALEKAGKRKKKRDNKSKRALIAAIRG